RAISPGRAILIRGGFWLRCRGSTRAGPSCRCWSARPHERHPRPGARHFLRPDAGDLRHRPCDRRGREFRAGGGIRLGQIHRAQSHRRARARLARPPRSLGHPPLAWRRPKGRATVPDGVPGPLWLASSAQDGRRDAGRAAAHPRDRGRWRADRKDDGGGRARPALPLPLSAPAVRRPAAACRHRPGADAGAENPAARRADVGPRRFGPGGNPQPAQAASRGAEPHLPAGNAQPARRLLPLRQAGGDAARPDRRNRRGRSAQARRPRKSLFPRACRAERRPPPCPRRTISMTDKTQAALKAFDTAIATLKHADDAWQALRVLAETLVDAKLFTVMTVDWENERAGRVFTSHPEEYPVSGTKPLHYDSWFD